MSAPARPPAFGEPAPWFRAKALSGNDGYAFDTAAGRAILLLFLGTVSQSVSAAALSLVAAQRGLFDDERGCFFGVTTDPEDATQGRIAQHLPGIRFFLDYDRRVSLLYGVSEGDRYTLGWLVLDRQLRVAGRFAIGEGEAAIACYAAHANEQRSDLWAPVLLAPRVLEPELCQHLIDQYEATGGEESGFMREVGGKTVGILDPAHKRRADMTIESEELRRALMVRIHDRLIPMIERAFQFRATRMERYIVACYDSAAGGHFRAHRDNTTKGTAHRRFAVSINLNAGDYEGGELCFPEFGQRLYRPPTGGAVVFSCSLLHEARPVTRGRRYAFLPFLYDDAAARQREANNPYLDENVGAYRG